MEKGYKGFNENLQCTQNGKVFQYEVGKTYKEPEAALCKCGFHFCKNPFYVWHYYGVFGSRFCVVEADSANVIDSNNKSVSKQIKIKAELPLEAFVNECVAYMINLCDKKVGASDAGPSGSYAQIGSSGDCAKISSSGYATQIGSSGNGTQIGSSGDAAKIGSSGNGTKIGSSGNAAKICSNGYATQIGLSGNCDQIGSNGDYVKISSSGNYVQIGSSGNYAQIGSSGNHAQIGSSGNHAQIGSSGDYAKIDCSGNDSIVAAIGKHSAVKAAKGCWIVLAEYDRSGKPVTVVSKKIDGKKLKAETYYTLKKGKIVQVKE